MHAHTHWFININMQTQKHCDSVSVIDYGKICTVICKTARMRVVIISNGTALGHTHTNTSYMNWNSMVVICISFPYQALSMGTLGKTDYTAFMCT